MKSTLKALVLGTCLILGYAQPVKEDLTLHQDDREVYLRENQPLTISCYIQSKPKQAEYSWHKNGKPLDLALSNAVQESDGLLIKKPTSADEGEYQCFAKTMHGVASSQIIKVKRTFMNTPELKKINLTPVEGKPYKLDCPCPEGYPKPTIVWEYEELSKRITQGPDGSLYFSNVTKEDAHNTKYLCYATSPAHEKRVPLYEYLLKGVVESTDKNGELTPQYLSQDMMVKAGDVTMIYCIYGGTPLAFPDWFHEGKNVNGKPGDRVTRHNRTGGKRLLISETLFTDQGTYTCEANNEIGKLQKHSVKITVVGAPKYLKKPESTLSTSAGQEVVIPCQVEGLPAPKITWTYNSQPLKENERVRIDTNGSAEKVSVANLMIKNVQKSDIGYYGCKTVNEHGSDYAESLLVVV